MKLPIIIVQLVHIYGPFKGEIQEFSESTILIGRHPSCHVLFPRDVAIVSRRHAQIIREGNRFKLIDQSANGTFVNGKRVKEAYLKDGDVLIFAEGGPKVSFLTKIVESQHEIEDIPLPTSLQEPEIAGVEKPSIARVQSESNLAEEFSMQEIQVPLVIQFGPTIRSFKKLPVTIGKNPDCDLSINHPAVLDRHAQIFFSQDQYWIKDLTGQMLISINGRPVNCQSPLIPENLVTLTLQGPTFRFLNGGRLAEIEKSDSEESVNVLPEKEKTCPPDKNQEGCIKKAMSISNKFLRLIVDWWKNLF
ncbi:MAG: FHA domain-containing protein [Desulfobacteraceae bacterium]|nr:FHA domain-containing protein [Desulfobacteraceae bacterium]MBC2719661.1 FHA domain-containing protein [Desulfobacteraceae bacterium]